MALHALILTVFDHLSLLGVLLFYYLVMLMHMFLFMFTCMEERPAISRADFQTRIESRQLDELHKCPYLHNSSRASTFNSLQFHFDSRLCPKLEQIYTPILNIGVLPVTSTGQAKAISQGLSSRTVTFAHLISKFISVFCLAHCCLILYVTKQLFYFSRTGLSFISLTCFDNIDIF